MEGSLGSLLPAQSHAVGAQHHARLFAPALLRQRLGAFGPKTSLSSHSATPATAGTAPLAFTEDVTVYNSI